MGILETIVLTKLLRYFGHFELNGILCPKKKHVRLQSLVEKNTKTLSASKKIPSYLKES